MSVLFAFLAAMSPATDPVPPSEPMPEIVVIAERLKGVQVFIGQDEEGSWHCSLDRSSGVPSLDSKLCKAVTKCVRKGASTDSEVEQCVTKNKKRLLARFERQYRNQK